MFLSVHTHCGIPMFALFSYTTFFMTLDNDGNCVTAQVKTAYAFYGSCLLLLYKTIQWGSQTNKNNAQLQLKCLIGTD